MSRRREVAADTRAPGTRLAHVLEVGLQARMQAARLTPLPRQHAVDMKRKDENTVRVTRDVVKQLEPGTWPETLEVPNDANVGSHTDSEKLWMFKLFTKRDDGGEETSKMCYTYRDMREIAVYFRQLAEQNGDSAIAVEELARYSEKYGMEPFYLPKWTWLSKEKKLRMSMHFVTKASPRAYDTYQFTTSRWDGLTAPFTNRGRTREEPQLYITSLMQIPVDYFRGILPEEEFPQLWEKLKDVQTHRESQPFEGPDESKRQRTALREQEASVPKQHAVDMKRKTQKTAFVTRDVVKQVEPGWPWSGKLEVPRDANVGRHTYSTRLYQFKLFTKRDDGGEETSKMCYTYRDMREIAVYFRQLAEQNGDSAIAVEELARYSEKYGMEPFYLPKWTWLSKEKKLRMSMHFVTKASPRAYDTYQFTTSRWDGLTAPFTNRGRTREEPQLYITALMSLDVDYYREKYPEEEFPQLWEELKDVQTHRESQPLVEPGGLAAMGPD